MELKRLLEYHGGIQMANDKQAVALPKTKELFASFQNTFKRAFQEEKARCDVLIDELASVHVVSNSNHANTTVMTQKLKQKLNLHNPYRTLLEDKVGCGDDLPVINSPPKTLPAPTTPTISNDSSIRSPTNGTNEWASKPAQLLPQSVDVALVNTHRALGLRTTSPLLQFTCKLYTPVQALASDSTARPHESQFDLAEPSGRPSTVCLATSRGSSTAKFRGLMLSSGTVNGIQACVDSGKLKPGQHTAHVEPAQAQPSIDEALSPKARASSSEDQLLLTSFEATKSQKEVLEEEFEKKLAFKDDTISQVLSRYQALCAEHEELKHQSKNSSNRSLESELLNIQQRARDLGCELANAERRSREQESQLFQAYKENREQESQLFQAYKEQIQYKNHIATLKRANTKSTRDFIDLKSECEKTSYKNFVLRGAMETDLARTAATDNAVEVLKKGLLDMEERAMQAEERTIQLQQREVEEKIIRQAEMTALTSQNIMLKEAAHGLLVSKQSNQRAVDSFLEKVQDGVTKDSLRAAFEAYCWTVKQDEQLEVSVIELTRTHSKAIEHVKSLQNTCNALKTVAKEDKARYLSLETEYRKKSDTVDILQMEADLKVEEFEQALRNKDVELDAAKRESAYYLQVLEQFSQGTADACTSWYLNYKDWEVEKAKAASKSLKNVVEDLREELRALKWFQADAAIYYNLQKDAFSQYPQQLAESHKEVKKLQGKLAEYEAQLSPDQFLPQDPDSLAASRKVIKGLEKKLEEYDFKFSSQDYIKWEEHVSHLEHVRAETETRVESQVREQMEATFEETLLVKLGAEFVIPLIQLGGHFWERIGRLEYVIACHLGCKIEENEREILMRASREFQIDTSRGTFPRR